MSKKVTPEELQRIRDLASANLDNKQSQPTTPQDANPIVDEAAYARNNQAQSNKAVNKPAPTQVSNKQPNSNKQRSNKPQFHVPTHQVGSPIDVVPGDTKPRSTSAEQLFAPHTTVKKSKKPDPNINPKTGSQWSSSVERNLFFIERNEQFAEQRLSDIRRKMEKLKLEEELTANMLESHIVQKLLIRGDICVSKCTFKDIHGNVIDIMKSNVAVHPKVMSMDPSKVVVDFNAELGDNIGDDDEDHQDDFDEQDDFIDYYDGSIYNDGNGGEIKL